MSTASEGKYNGATNSSRYSHRIAVGAISYGQAAARASSNTIGSSIRDYLRDRRQVARIWQIDALRGFALLVMILDHAILTAGWDDSPLRLLTRIAMPLFFIIAGNLVRRFHWTRMAAILVVGYALNAIAPMFGSFELFSGLIIGCAIVAFCKSVGARFIALTILMTMTANFYVWQAGYLFWMLPAFIIIGALLPRDTLVNFGSKFPRWIAPLGEWPLTLYVAHILLLTAYKGLVLS